MLKNENKGIAFKARCCVRPDKHGRDHYFGVKFIRAMPSSFHCNNGRARFYIMPYKPPALKTIPLFSKYLTITSYELQL